jgi:hypothetical protein
MKTFRIPSILVKGKYLCHDDIMAIVYHFLTHRRKNLKAQIREDMAKLAALGQEFTAEEWKSAFDECDFDGIECAEKDQPEILQP